MPGVRFNSATDEASLFEPSTVLDSSVGCFSTVAAAAAGRRFALPHPMCSTAGFRSRRTVLGPVLASDAATPAAAAASTAGAGAGAGTEDVAIGSTCCRCRAPDTMTARVWSVGRVKILEKCTHPCIEKKNTWTKSLHLGQVIDSYFTI